MGLVYSYNTDKCHLLEQILLGMLESVSAIDYTPTLVKCCGTPLRRAQPTEHGDEQLPLEMSPPLDGDTPTWRYLTIASTSLPHN